MQGNTDPHKEQSFACRSRFVYRQQLWAGNIKYAQFWRLNQAVFIPLISDEILKIPQVIFYPVVSVYAGTITKKGKATPFSFTAQRLATT